MLATLTGTELLQVVPLRGDGTPGPFTETTNTQAIADLGSTEAFASPPALGNVTPNAVSATTLTASGVISGLVTAAGSTTPRVLAARFGQLANVLDFGAAGNGTTNDTAAIQAASASLNSLGGCLYFPTGNYLVNEPTLLASNTVAAADAGVTIIAAPIGTWVSTIGNSTFSNLHNAATTLTDRNIRVRGFRFDYQSQYGSNGAGDHIVQFNQAQDIEVGLCTFLGAGDATAFTSCDNTLVEFCAAYGFSNCAYDHWAGPNAGVVGGPKRGRVIGCYAESASSAQVVNWNPEYTSGSSAGNVADTFVLQGCEFVCTAGGGSVIPIQLEPLGAGTTVVNVTVTGNVFRSVTLVTRGATRGAVISGNLFDCPGTIGAAFGAYVFNSGTPDAISFAGNVIIDPATTSGNEGVITLDATNSSVENNIISGTQHYAAVYIGNSSGGPMVVAGNNFAAGLHDYQVIGPGTWTSGSAGISGVSVSATTLSATGTITPSTTHGIVGTTAGDSAQAGSVGEYLISSVTGAVPTTGVNFTLTTLSLTAGDWEVSGNALVNSPGGTASSARAFVSTSSAAPVGTGLGDFIIQNETAVYANIQCPTGTIRVNVTSTTTVYLVAFAQFTGTTTTAAGAIQARRVR